VPDLDHSVHGRNSLSIMNPLASVIAGCAPGEPDCAAGTIPTGIDIWFILLMLLLVVAFVDAWRCLCDARWQVVRSLSPGIPAERPRIGAALAASSLR
jgi:hypothetical protein